MTHQLHHPATHATEPRRDAQPAPRRRRASLARRVGALSTAGLVAGLLLPALPAPAWATPPPAYKTYTLATGLTSPLGLYGDFSVGNTAYYNVQVHNGDLYITGDYLTRIKASGGQADFFNFGYVSDIAFDSAGNAYIASADRNVVYKTNPDLSNPVIFAGTLTTAGDASTGTGLLNQPSALAIDGSNNVYVASPANYGSDPGGSEVAKVTPAGTMTRFVGVQDPASLAFDGAGNLLVADTSNNQIVSVNSAGTSSVLVGTGSAATTVPPGNTSSTNDPIRFPTSLDVAPNGDLLIGGQGAVWRVEHGTTTVDWLTGTLNDSAAVTPGATSQTNGIGQVRGVAAYRGGIVVSEVDGANRGQVRSLALPPSAAPSGISAVAGPRRAAVSVLSTDTGGLLPRYTVTASPGGQSCTTSTVQGTCNVTDLTVGTSYTFTATQATQAGTGTAASTVSNAVIPLAAVPGVPTAVAATAGNASANLTWTAPADNGGAAITGYTVTSTPGSLTCTSTTTACTVSGLTNGTAYTFRVKATNSAGTSNFSVASASVSPVAPPPSAGPSLLAQQITTTAPATLALTSRTAALNAVASGAGKLTYSTSSAGVCTVDASGVVSAVKAGTCTITITAAAAATHSAATKNVDITITAEQTVTAALPAGPQRFAGADRVATSADIAAKVFTTPAPGTSRDVVIATAGSFADALAGTRLAGQVGGPLLLTNGNTLSPEAAEQVKRLVAAGGTVYVLGGDAAVSDAVAKATGDLVTGDTLVRVGGANRFETAAMVADATVKRSGDVGPIYLVTGKDFADGVSVGAYAQSTGGVVLLTDGDKMPAATAKYLADHDPKGDRAVAIGGPAKAAATSAGLTGAASRAIVGADRFDTSAKLAAAMTKSSTSSSTASTTVASAGLAGGASWPDALAGSAAMAALGGPLLLTPTGSETVPASTASALSGLDAKRVLVFGGTSVIPAKAYDKAGALLDS
ncbi:hypothetical protein FHN55_15345 [Streptomyces sp. NP160]|uniref:cell wall-binding repeat-containing protein n=1 Tax=Streptomyces sp. NP160 TaxID=2586637 RepID=UPI00111B7406|nr:cell wall-binding repeat-containing protein [Streptomyces sp. NP160]TNM63221.1 hypothetical protein FHN55_15345 [Streptomyces sp. NP160]